MNFIQQDIVDYCEKYSSHESNVLNAISRKTYLTQINPRMLSGHLEGLFLKFITKLLNPRCVLEIGTFTGYSAICMAEVLDSNAILHTVEMDEELKNTIETNIKDAGVEDKIRLHIGDAMEIVPKLLTENTFDLIFIDADKGNYPNYFAMVKNNMKKGGVMIADNVLWSGKILDKEAVLNDPDTKAIHAFNENLEADSSFQKMVLPLRDGITVAMKL